MENKREIHSFDYEEPHQKQNSKLDKKSLNEKRKKIQNLSAEEPAIGPDAYKKPKSKISIRLRFTLYHLNIFDLSL